MVGDHAPAFITNLDTKEVDKSKISISQRAVPYVIWSNYETRVSENADYISMVDLMPMVIKKAGLPISPFYKVILDLHAMVPVRTSEGLYVDRSGAIGSVTDVKSEYYNLLEKYYDIEYNSLVGGEEYRYELFQP